MTHFTRIEHSRYRYIDHVCQTYRGEREMSQIETQ